MTTYRPGTEWRPEPLSPGRGALALLANTVPARERPAQALRALTRAVDGAILLDTAGNPLATPDPPTGPRV